MARADSLIIEAEAAPLTDPDALTHDVVVSYESVHGVDLDSLGDDDIIVGRHSLFGPGLGSAAPLARLGDFEVTQNGQKVSATYLLDRPEEGWHLWEAEDLTLQVAEGSVGDLEGNTVSSTRVVGILILDLEGERPRPITATLVNQPLILDLLQAYVDIEVHYSATIPLRPSHFGSHDLYVHAEREVLVPSRQTLSLPLNEEGQVGTTAEARYRVFRPLAGWGDRPLTVFADLLAPAFGSERIGAIEISKTERLAITLRTSDTIGLEHRGDFAFEVIYTNSGFGLDEESLGDDDLVVEQQLLQAPGLQMASPVFDGYRRERMPSGDRVVASYRIPEPRDGWASWKKLTPYVRLQSERVFDLAGQSYPDRLVGRLPLDEGLLPRPQQLVFEDWVRDLSKQLGLGKPPPRTRDQDRDGLSDLHEVTFGTEPNDASEASPMAITTKKIEGRTYLELTVRVRPEAFGTYVCIEGSEDGREWAPADEMFERMTTEQDLESLTETVVWRSLLPRVDLGARFFRLAVKKPKAQS